VSSARFKVRLESAWASSTSGDHDLRPPQPVRPHAADQEEAHQRQELGGQHDADVGRVLREVRHEQRERHDHDAVAHRARGLREPEVAEVAMAQDAEAFPHRGLA